jgi:hypothetical protein
MVQNTHIDEQQTDRYNSHMYNLPAYDDKQINSYNKTN